MGPGAISIVGTGDGVEGGRGTAKGGGGDGENMGLGYEFWS